MIDTPVLTARHLRLHRGGRDILDDVGLYILPGESVAVTGPSGSGKSTLLTLLAGVERPDAGEILLDGQPVTGPGPSIALILQGYGLLGLLTAAENVEVALRASGRSPRDAVPAGDQALRSIGLDGHTAQLVDELSGGQQQRVAVARSLALAPRLLLADEPTAEQDPAHRELVVERLLHRDGSARAGSGRAGSGRAGSDRALLIATHDPEIAARCDRVVELHQGRVVP